MKLQEEDIDEAVRDILFAISKQLANASYPAFEQASYKTPNYIGCCQHPIILEPLLFSCHGAAIGLRTTMGS